MNASILEMPQFLLVFSNRILRAAKLSAIQIRACFLTRETEAVCAVQSNCGISYRGIHSLISIVQLRDCPDGE